MTLSDKYLKRSWSNPVVGFGTVTLCVYDGVQKYADVEQQLVYYRSKGLISIGSMTEDGNCPAAWATVSLTNEGKKYLAAGVGEVKVFDRSFGELTGIQTNEQVKAAKADYTVKMINVTPFGSNVSIEPLSRTATFSLFDDGWRIDPANVQAAPIRFLAMPAPLPKPITLEGLVGDWAGAFKNDERAHLEIAINGQIVLARLNHNGWVEILSGALAEGGIVLLKETDKVGFGTIASMHSLLTAQLEATSDSSSLILRYRDEAGSNGAIEITKIR